MLRSYVLDEPSVEMTVGDRTYGQEARFSDVKRHNRASS